MAKRYNILTDPLPKVIIVDGAEFPIQADFRTGIRFEELIRGRASDEEKIVGMLRMYFGENIPENLEHAISGILSFYGAGQKPEEEPKEKQESRARGKSKIYYSFMQDAPYIFAAFLQQYGINLARIQPEELHWWEFVAMFESLDDSTLIKKIMYYRSVSTEGMSPRERKQIKRLKDIYRLTDDTPTDAKTALAKRNANMRAYVQQRTKNAAAPE